MNGTQLRPDPLFLKSGVVQVGLVVAGPERAAASYRQTFGIGPWHIYTNAN